MDLAGTLDLFVSLPNVTILGKFQFSFFTLNLALLIGILRMGDWTWLEAQVMDPTVL